MEKIKKGDIVGRISYGKDILFIVEKIIKTSNNNTYAILKGLNIRIKADSPIEDLELIGKDKIIENERIFQERYEKRIKRREHKNILSREREIIYTGKILHLDGDRRYSEKSDRYYKKLGLNAIVRNIAENKQALVVNNLLKRYKPDILIVTGHDGMIRKGTKFNDIYNYRNSRYFIETVLAARKSNATNKDLVIFAGACQSYYEGIMIAGANFASSPERILIDFLDPLIVAEKVATTDERNYITIFDIESELRDGKKGIDGIGAFGKKKKMTIL